MADPENNNDKDKDNDSDANSTSSSSISITSTAPSEERSDYEFEEIISEATVRGTKYYLVSWTNYRLDESTWEPISHFDDPEQALANWEETKRAIERGEKRPVDIYAIRRQAIHREIAAQRRRLKRRAKKKRLGIPVDSDTECELTPADFDQWEPSEPDSADGDEELPSQPIWAAFRPIRLRRYAPRVRRRKAGQGTSTPLTLSDSSDDESESVSNRSRTGQVERERERETEASKRQRKKTHSAAVNAITLDPEPTRQAQEASASTSRFRENDKGKGKARETQRDRLDDSVLTGHEYVSASSTTIFDPRHPSSAQRALANIKSRKHNHSRTTMPPNKGYLYKKLSTLNRHQKAAREERPPDINQVELFRPGEDVPSMMSTLRGQKRRVDSIFDRGRDESRSDRDRERPPEGNVFARRKSIAQGNTSSRGGAWPFIAPPPPPPSSSSRIDHPSKPTPKKLRPSASAPNVGRPKRNVKKWEAMIYLRVNNKEVGVVKMGELPPPVLNMLSRLPQRDRAAEFFIYDLCNLKQYASLCEKVRYSQFQNFFSFGMFFTDYQSVASLQIRSAIRTL